MNPCVLLVLASSLILGLSDGVTADAPGDDWMNVAEAIAGIATAAGIVVGGIWAYWLYVRQRTRWPRAELELTLTHRTLVDELILLSTKVKVHNSGRGLMQPSSLRIDLCRVLPLSPADRRSLVEKRNLLDGEGFEAAWPCIDSRERAWEKGAFDIEPGENDECVFDFFVEGSVETVFVYAYVDNRKKRKWLKAKKLGWSLTAIYDLTQSAGTASADNLVRRESTIEDRDKRPGLPQSPGEGGLEEAQREPRPEPKIEKTSPEPESAEPEVGDSDGDDRE
jgi:hypothetical protein